MQVEQAVNKPWQRPTVKVQYQGRPPKGIFDNLEQQLLAYHHSYMDGDTIVYNTDLSQMKLYLERPRNAEAGVKYEYQELTTTVPYGMCLDFIEENLGKADDGFILRRIECTQEGLGLDF